MGLAAAMFWIVIILFMVPFVYTAIVYFRDKASRDTKLREIQQRLSEIQDSEE